MILRAKQDGSILIFQLEGQIDFESTQRFREKYLQIVSKQPTNKVVFDFQKLKFVGSSGINHFIQVMHEFNHAKIRPRFCNLSSEFERLFRALESRRSKFNIFEDQRSAIDSLVNDLAPPAKKRNGRQRDV